MQKTNKALFIVIIFLFSFFCSFQSFAAEEELEKRLNNIESTLLAVEDNVRIHKELSRIPDDFRFSEDLREGNVKKEIEYLQIILNSNKKTAVSSSGLGSLGNETHLFGTATRNALNNFQDEYLSQELVGAGFSRAKGYVGIHTREKLNQFIESRKNTPEEVYGVIEQIKKEIDVLKNRIKNISASSDMPLKKLDKDIEDVLEKILQEAREKELENDLQDIINKIKEKLARKELEEEINNIIKKIEEELAGKELEEKLEDIIDKIKEELAGKELEEKLSEIAEKIEEERRKEELEKQMEDLLKKIQEKIDEEKIEEDMENIIEEIKEELEKKELEEKIEDIVEELKDKLEKEELERQMEGIVEELKGKL